MIGRPAIFLGIPKIDLRDLSIYLDDHLIEDHEGYIGKWISHPLTLEELSLQKAFIISLLKKIDPKYDLRENPLKLILSLNESRD